MTAGKTLDRARSSEMEGTTIDWDESSVKSACANVCNVASTREEVVMLFGMNQAWERGQKEVTIRLSDRIVIRTEYAVQVQAPPV